MDDLPPRAQPGSPEYEAAKASPAARSALGRLARELDLPLSEVPSPPGSAPWDERVMTYAADRELRATLHALAAPMLAGRVESYVDLPARGIDFEGMLAGHWSTTERAMIEVACTLWGRGDIADATLSPVLYSMDGGNFERVIEAMRIRRGLD